MNFGVCYTASVNGWLLRRLTGSWKSMLSNLIAQVWDLLLRRWRDILGPSRCYGIHHRLARHIVIRSLGCRNTETRKENKNRQRGNWHCGQVLIHEDADVSHLGYL